jgi:hypothetical protein
MYILEKGLSYQRLILVVQEKLDCPVSETRLSGFHGFKPLGQNLPIHRFSHFSLPFTIFLTSLSPSPFFSLLSLSRTTVRASPRPPLAIPWFLRGILELLGEIISTRTGVSVPPTGFSSSQDIFT